MSDQIPVYQPTTETNTAPRYSVRTDIPPSARTFGVVAWVLDTQHPDDPEGYTGAPCCWCQDVADAARIAAGLNRDEMFRERLRFLIVDEVVGAINRVPAYGPGSIADAATYDKAPAEVAGPVEPEVTA